LARSSTGIANGGANKVSRAFLLDRFPEITLDGQQRRVVKTGWVDTLGLMSEIDGQDLLETGCAEGGSVLIRMGAEEKDVVTGKSVGVGVSLAGAQRRLSSVGGTGRRIRAGGVARCLSTPLV